MSQEDSPKEEKGQINQPEQDIKKGRNYERSSGEDYTKLHSYIGTIREGYQPIVDISTPPPDGGSGVPEKSDE